MSTQTITLPGARHINPAGGAASQATVVEQSRAVAEVQAAVVVAQANPRDIDRALADMRDTCGRLPVASRAFYAVPNRGQGLSVHIMRELARIWGNNDYGVRELRRDDEAGVSEMQAWAWDQQTNTRSTRSFIQPHQRMKGRERQALVDLNDVYLNNQNTGARAVRECVSSILPGWFVAEAEAVCRRTLEHGEGKSVDERSREATSAFAAQGVTRSQLEDFLGAKYGKWTPTQLAELTRVYTAITQDGIPAADFFTDQPVVVSIAPGVGGQPAAPASPPVSVPAQDPAPAPEPEEAAQEGPAAPLAATQKQLTAIRAGLADVRGITDREEVLAWVSEAVGRPLESSKWLTRIEAGVVLDRIANERDAATTEPDATS